MLRGAIISPNAEFTEKLVSFLADVGQIGIVRSLTYYPNTMELARFVRANAPQVLFLSMDGLDKAAEVVAGIEANSQGVQIVAIHRNYDPQIMLEVMRLGIREFLSMPFSRDSLHEMVRALVGWPGETPDSVWEHRAGLRVSAGESGRGSIHDCAECLDGDGPANQ